MECQLVSSAVQKLAAMIRWGGREMMSTLSFSAEKNREEPKFCLKSRKHLFSLVTQ
jgi:hypothetical protein